MTWASLTRNKFKIEHQRILERYSKFIFKTYEVGKINRHFHHIIFSLNCVEINEVFQLWRIFWPLKDILCMNFTAIVGQHNLGCLSIVSWFGWLLGNVLMSNVNWNVLKHGYQKVVTFLSLGAVLCRLLFIFFVARFYFVWFCNETVSLFPTCDHACLFDIFYLYFISSYNV